MKSRVIVSAVIEKGNLLLFGRKLENIWPYPNTWHLIWWWIKEWESLKDGIAREILEEAGIEVEIQESISFDEDFEPNKYDELTHYIFLVFRAKYLWGEVIAWDDIRKLEWIPREKLSEIELNKPSIELFTKMGYL